MGDIYKFRNAQTKEECSVFIPSNISWSQLIGLVSLRLDLKHSVTHFALVQQTSPFPVSTIADVNQFVDGCKLYSTVPGPAFVVHLGNSVESCGIDTSAHLDKKLDSSNIRAVNVNSTTHFDGNTTAKQSIDKPLQTSPHNSPPSLAFIGIQKHQSVVQSSNNGTSNQCRIAIKVADSNSGEVFHVSVPAKCPWNDLVKYITTEFNLVRCDTITLMLKDSDMDRMSPVIDSDSKFWKYYTTHCREDGSYFEVLGGNNVLSEPSLPSTRGSPQRIGQRADDILSTSPELPLQKKPALSSSKDCSQSGSSKTKRQYNTCSTQLADATKAVRASIPSHDLSALMDACSRGDIATVQRLCDQSPSALCHCDDSGNTPLHIAALHSQNAVLEYLLRSRANILARNNVENTCIHILCAKGNLPIVKQMKVSPGFDVNLPRPDDTRLLHLACRSGNYDLVVWLVENGAKDMNIVNENSVTPLHFSCLGPHLKIAQYLVAQGAHVNVRDKSGFTPLFFACSFADFVMVQWLVSQGALVDIASHKGDTPLHLAVARGDESIARFLAEQGANLELRNGDGLTAVERAQLRKNTQLAHGLLSIYQKGCPSPDEVDIVAAFHKACADGREIDVASYLDQGIDPGVRNSKYYTGLHFAAMYGKIEIAEMLLDSGAEVNGIDRHLGKTPLHLASEHSQVEMSQWLVQRGGANVMLCSFDGRNCLHYAALSGNSALMEWFVELGVNPHAVTVEGSSVLHNCCFAGNLPGAMLCVSLGVSETLTDSYKSTPLHVACEHGFEDLARWLLDVNSDHINAPNIHGMTPFLLAVFNGHFELVKVLSDRGADTNARAYAARQRNSAAHFACIRGSLRIFQWLATCLHADCSSFNNQHETPVSLARKHNHKEILSWVAEFGAEHGIDMEALSDCCQVLDTSPVSNSNCLIPAVRAGDLDLVNHLVSNGANVNMTYEKGVTALHAASSQGRLDIVKYLVEHGADVSIKDNEGMTAYDYAVNGNHSYIAMWLKPSEVKSLCKTKSPSMLFSCFTLSDDIADCPPSEPTSDYESNAESIAPSRYNDFRVACSDNDLNTVKALVKQDSMCVRTTIQPTGRTGLHYACLHGNLGIAEYLIENGSDINAVDDEGSTPLHLACEEGKNDVALVLIRSGADMSIYDDFGTTALHKVCEHGLLSLMKRIIDYSQSVLDLDMTMKTEDGGLSAMHIAVDKENVDMVKLLTSVPDLVNARDEFHRTPLHVCSIDGNCTIAEILLDCGAFINARDDDSMTPLLYSCTNGHLKLAKLLVSRGANVLAESEKQGNCLHMACKRNDFTMIKWLVVKCGVDPNGESFQGVSPLQIARSLESTQIADWLLARCSTSS